jgi:transposase
VTPLAPYITAFLRERLPIDRRASEHMWKPYLGLIREKCSQALNILDRFHIVAKVNKALDDIRSAEARRMKGDGYEPVLSKFPVVPSQAAGQPHRQPEGETERPGALQPPERSRLSAQGRLPATLELRVHRLGRQSSSTSGAAK